MRPKLGKNDYLTRIGIFLIAIALIVGTVSCDGGGGGPYTLTMEENPPAGGTATDLTGASPYAANTVVNITAAANPGYSFSSWSAPAGQFGNAAAATTTFTMPSQNVIVTANFAQPPFCGGDGTEGAPYQIADWNHLNNVRNYLDSCFILVNNLDLSSIGYTELASATANGGKGWLPIGTENDAFAGSLDGQGYELRDLFINRPDEDGVGLFGAVDVGGVIENVEIVDADVTGDDGVGILVGAGGCSVSNSSSTGHVTGGDGVGGLMGVNYGNISDCYSTASLTAGNNTVALGGLVGLNEGDVSNSYAIGSVDGFSWVGGLVGWNSGTIDNCCFTGSVTAEEQVVGGLAGENDLDGTVTNSYSTSNVAGNGSVGGLVGWNRGTLDSSYATGSVTGSNDYVGGLVGENGDYATIDDSYATGSVTGNVSVGGLVGSNYGTVSNSFWDTQTSGQGTSDGGTGKTTAQMKYFTTFSDAGWDIVTVANSSTRNISYIWNIVDPGPVTYPFLSWQP